MGFALGLGPWNIVSKLAGDLFQSGYRKRHVNGLPRFTNVDLQLARVRANLHVIVAVDNLNQIRLRIFLEFLC